MTSTPKKAVMQVVCESVALAWGQPNFTLMTDDWMRTTADRAPKILASAPAVSCDSCAQARIKRESHSGGEGRIDT